jgi:hypothetical protein
MTPRGHSTITAGERRTQEARRIHAQAALLTRLRTRYRAGQRAVAAVVSLFSSLSRPDLGAREDLAEQPCPLLVYLRTLQRIGSSIHSIDNDTRGL